VGSDSGLHYFAMELLEGGSARDAMGAEGGSLSELRALEIVREAALACRPRTPRAILHRDVKAGQPFFYNHEGTAEIDGSGHRAARAVRRRTAARSGAVRRRAPEIVRGTGLSDGTQRHLQPGRDAL